jgi:hypothetical protein
MTNWRLSYAESDQWQWYHPDNSEHYLTVARAAPEKDHEWYVLPHIGTLAPDDSRYDGPDRIACLDRADAQDRADDYLRANPTGHQRRALDADQQSYDPETGETTPL